MKSKCLSLLALAASMTCSQAFADASPSLEEVTLAPIVSAANSLRPGVVEDEYPVKQGSVTAGVSSSSRRTFSTRENKKPNGPAKADSTPAVPGHSNYYGDVTINYVMPSEEEPTVFRPSSFESKPASLTRNLGSVLPECSGKCGGKTCCCDKRCLSFFGEALYWRAGNMDIVYAVEQNGCDPATAIPTGPQGILSPDAELGFRAGFSCPMTDCSSIVATYTWYNADTSSSIMATPDNFLASQVTHPSLENCGMGSLASSAEFEIDLQFVDLDYHRTLRRSCNWNINYTAGVRYGSFEQEFQSQQTLAAAVGLANVRTDIDFDGLGIKLGLDGERFSSTSGFFIYGKGNASFLGGEYKADYLQTNQFGGGTDIRVSREDYRLSTILEAELGFGWRSCDDRFRISAGYSAMGWHNALLTNSFLEQIRNGGKFDNSDFATFDGLVARFEYRR